MGGTVTQVFRNLQALTGEFLSKVVVVAPVFRQRHPGESQ